jgi:hypothetical protein
MRLTIFPLLCNIGIEDVCRIRVVGMTFDRKDKNVEEDRGYSRYIKKTVFAPYEISRKYFRVKFPYLLETEMTPVYVKGKEVTAGKTHVLVRNMGPGGFCFVSDLNLPVGKDIFYVFSSEIMEEKISALAYVVWMNEMEGNGLYEYGAEFDVNEHERANIQKLLMRVQIKINKENMLFDEGNFVYGYPEDYFRMKRKKK